MDSNHGGSESPPPRTNILGAFLRGRPRNSSINIISTDIRELSPSPPQPPSPNALVAGNRRRPAAATAVSPVQASTSHQSTTNNTTAGLGLSHMLRRRRSAGTLALPANTPPVAAMPGQQSAAAPLAVSVSVPAQTGAGPGHRIRLVPHLDSRRSLRFDAIGRDLKESDPPLRIGRFTDRSGLGLAAINALGSNKLAFKSKVVSRAHAEIWVESGGRFFIKDTKSSSGTFLNHIRLSPANTESRPYQMKDGDILQLGVDYQGGAEDIYKSVKIRIEVGREWQAAANAFNTNALKNLKTLAVTPIKPHAAGTLTVTKTTSARKSQIPDCCICLFSVTIRQALFIAPCSHTFHYKCIRPMLETHHPAFSCPLCRTFADLEEDVEVETEALDEGDDEDDDSAVGEEQPATAEQPETALAADGQERGTREQEKEKDGGAETEVEADGVRVRVRGQGARTAPLVDGSVDEQNEEDVVMFDVDPGSGAVGGDGGQQPRVQRPEEDSDGDLVDDAGLVAGVDSEGSGSGEGADAECPPLGEMGEVDDGVEGPDGTVGGKRKR